MIKFWQEFKLCCEKLFPDMINDLPFMHFIIISNVIHLWALSHHNESLFTPTETEAERGGFCSD